MHEDARFAKQVRFILELDKEKTILRQTHLTGYRRQENDAEHAWHMAVMACLLKEYANEPFDLARTLLMILLHDVVEIDAGDTFAYDLEAVKTQREREKKAAERIFGLLPEDQAREFRGLFEEFEQGDTPEARYAHAMDNFQPILLNDANDMPVIFSRVSELYLIKAEALYRSGASISEAYAPIRKLRERAGAEIILPANNEELETAIFNEWMLELSFENWHEWFAMIRFAGYTEKPDFTRLLALNKTLREALEKEYEKSEAQGDNYYQRIIDRRIDAIPSSEISSNLECKQNPGY